MVSIAMGGGHPEASVRALESRVAEARVQISDTTLVAPYDGTIAEVFVRTNQAVRPAESIARFQNVDEIEIAADIPEALMTIELRSDDIASMEATFSGVPGRRFPVRISEMAQFADPATRTFRVRFALANPEGVSILPGMTSTVEVSARRPGAVRSIRVPLSAVLRRPTGDSVVWIIGEDRTTRARPVQLGPVLGNEIEIASGLQEGERIAIAGASLLREGMTVRDLGDALGGRSGGATR
jgi:RND family efflux transporter MFP subunit